LQDFENASELNFTLLNETTAAFAGDSNWKAGMIPNEPNLSLGVER